MVAGIGKPWVQGWKQFTVPTTRAPIHQSLSLQLLPLLQVPTDSNGERHWNMLWGNQPVGKTATLDLLRCPSIETLLLLSVTDFFFWVWFFFFGLWLENKVYDFNYFQFIEVVDGLHYGLSWYVFHVSLRRMCVLLFSEVFCKSVT